MHYLEESKACLSTYLNQEDLRFLIEVYLLHCDLEKVQQDHVAQVEDNLVSSQAVSRLAIHFFSKFYWVITYHTML